MADFAQVKMDTMNDIANAVIEKGGADGPMYPREIVDGIRSLVASSAPQFTEAQTAVLNSGATKAKIDSLSNFVKTINGTTPDGNGNQLC